MEHSFSAVYGSVRLRPLAKEDTEMLRQWRNDKSQTEFLRDIGYITPEMQEKWFRGYLDDRSQIIFAIDEISELCRMVGSVALYDIEGSCAEIGKIQIGDSEAHGRGIGRKSLVMAMKVGFQKLGLDRIVGLVDVRNEAARRNDLRVGFKVVGEKLTEDGSRELELLITEEDVREANRYYDEIELNG